MIHLLAFPVYVRPTETIRHAGDTTAMDWFVIATLCFFFFLLGCFATAAWVIWRRTTRPAPHIRLLMELEEAEEKAEVSPASESGIQNPTQPSWEKEPDWWRR